MGEHEVAAALQPFAAAVWALTSDDASDEARAEARREARVALTRLERIHGARMTRQFLRDAIIFLDHAATKQTAGL